MKLKGKVALVTGAGSGIGQAIAIAFAREGADVAVNDVELARANETCLVIKDKLKRNAIPVIADISDAADVDKMVDRTLAEFNKLDILVNNAGIGDQVDVPTIEQTVTVWDQVIRVHLRGTYLCSRRVGQLMIQHNGGTILNIASILGIGPTPRRTAYAPAKAGIINLTVLLAVEWAPHNIRVNAIAPGYIWTPLSEKSAKEGKIDRESHVRRVPLGRWGKPDEVAGAAVFLVSDDAGYITGITLPVDGGWLANRQ